MFAFYEMVSYQVAARNIGTYYIMIGEKLHTQSLLVRKLQFTVHSWDFVRKMNGWAILAATCHMSNPLIFDGLVDKDRE